MTVRYNIHATRIVQLEGTMPIKYVAQLHISDLDSIELSPHYESDTPRGLGRRIAEIEQPKGTQGILFLYDEKDKSTQTPVKGGGFVDFLRLERDEREELLKGYLERYEQKRLAGAETLC